MNTKLKKPLEKEDLCKRVTKIAFDRNDIEHSPMQVKVNGEEKERSCMTVFATPTLACLQRIELTGLELLYEQKEALRSLHYDTASKVAMNFHLGGLNWASMEVWLRQTCHFVLAYTPRTTRMISTWRVRLSNQLCSCVPTHGLKMPQESAL